MPQDKFRLKKPIIKMYRSIPKHQTGDRLLINKIIKQFLNEDKEYIKWCTEHRYVEDLQINNLEK